MFRRSLAVAILLTAAVASNSHAQVDNSDLPRAKPPAYLQAGVSQNQGDDIDAAEAQLANDQQWELDARTVAAEQEEAQAGTFMSSPLVFRVTSVGEINKTSGKQQITAMVIHTVTISTDGKVDLGQIVDGSGDGFEIPPGTLQKGDLFTRVANQYIKVAANHFDAMGSLADQVNKQVPADSQTALNKLANQLADAMDGYAQNAANFTNDFLLGAGAVMGNTLQTLAQPRGNFGQPGKPLQDIINYVNNDYGANQVTLGNAAKQAMQTLATHPGTLMGAALISSLPAGGIGRDAEVSQVSNATQRLSTAFSDSNEFTNVERNLPMPTNALQKIAQRMYPNGVTTPKPFQPNELTAGEFPKEWGGPEAVTPPGGFPKTPPRAPLPEPSGAPGTGGDTVRTPGTGGDTVRTPGTGGDTVRTPGTGGDTVRTPGGAAEVPTAGAGDPDAPTVRTPAPPAEPSPLGSDPNSPLQSRKIPTGADTPDNPQLSQAARDARSRQIANQRAAEAARENAMRQGNYAPQKAVPLSAQRQQVLSPSAPPKAIPMTPEQVQSLRNNLQKLMPALDQDAKWSGSPVQSATSPPPQQPGATPTLNTAAPAKQPDIISTLASRFGKSPKDPLQGAPGLLESSAGIPVPATTGSINNALQLAGTKSQGLVFSQNLDHSLTILNARNNNGQIEYLDPATSQSAQPSPNAPLYFYRTQ